MRSPGLTSEDFAGVAFLISVSPTGMRRKDVLSSNLTVVSPVLSVFTVKTWPAASAAVTVPMTLTYFAGVCAKTGKTAETAIRARMVLMSLYYGRNQRVEGKER